MNVLAYAEMSDGSVLGRRARVLNPPEAAAVDRLRPVLANSGDRP